MFFPFKEHKPYQGTLGSLEVILIGSRIRPSPSMDPTGTLKGTAGSEPRKHTILPRNHDNFSEASYFFSGKFFILWSFSGRKGGTYCSRNSLFGIFVSNHWKNYPKCSISYDKYHFFLFFIKIFLGTRFLGSSGNLDSVLSPKISPMCDEGPKNLSRSLFLTK